MRHPAEPVVRIPTGSVTRPGAALATSVVVHMALLAGALLLGRAAGEPAPREPRLRPRVELIALPPIPRPPAVAIAPEEPPAPRPRRQVPRPQVTRGPDLPRDVYVSPETPPPDLAIAVPPAATAPDPAPEPVREQSDAAAASETAMEREAQRLFGPRRSGTGGDTGPIAARSWINALTEDRENDCIPRARPERPPGAPVEMGVVSGIVYREGSRQPLGGAFLQILGTPYSTFADARGAYALAFDKALVDDCRTQYVQVSKDGFAPRRLILSLGQRVSNDIPLSRR